MNRLLVESTEPSRYATLFLGEYDDGARRLRYVNCGHNPPALLRADGRVERLLPTAMVVGLVEEWTCDVAETVLGPGDLLVVYSDGISEAADGQEEEFGERRLVETAGAHRAEPLPDLLEAVFAEVRRFSRVTRPTTRRWSSRAASESERQPRGDWLTGPAADASGCAACP